MTADLREPAPWRLFARAWGYGAGCGAMLGVASVAPLIVVDPSEPGVVVFYSVYAAIVGGIVGSVVGLLGGAAIVMADADRPGNEHRAGSVGAIAAASPFLLFAAWWLASIPGMGPELWLDDGWVLVVAVVSVTTGAAVGPRVARGRSERLPARGGNRRTRTLCRRTALR
jgi:cytochrome bd-type quinol oxidase subunit 2